MKRGVSTIEGRRRKLRRELAALGRELRGAKVRRCTARRPGPRTVRVWTWDRGSRPVDMDGPARELVPVLETIFAGGLWKEFRKFPVDTLQRLLPDLRIPTHTRDLLEMWIEEAPARER